MTVVLVPSMLVCLVGLILYLIAKPTQAKLLSISLHMFWVGLLAFLLMYKR